MQTLIYDIEIAKAIPGGERIEGIEYCQGWEDFEGMGISVIGYQFGEESPEFALSLEEFFDELQFIDEPYCLIGFNSKGFDDLLVAANGCFLATDYDLLEEIRLAAGHKSHRSVPKGHSYRLDAIAKANGMAKTASGELAPVMWQRGQRQEVIDYCLMDIKITKAMLDLGLAGELIDPNTGRKLQLREIDSGY